VGAWRLLLRRRRVVAGLVVLVVMLVATLGSLPWMLEAAGGGDPTPRYNSGVLENARLAPGWWAGAGTGSGTAVSDVPAPGSVFNLMGTDGLGRSLLYRSLVGGAISLTVGLAAALISVVIGTAYGAIAGLLGGRVDGVMMRGVDVLYGLPYVLLVVLMAVAIDAAVERVVVARVVGLADERGRLIATELQGLDESARNDPAVRDRIHREVLERVGTGEMSQGFLKGINIATLLVAIGAVSWLTMARVVRGEVLSLKTRPFVEAARAMGASRTRILVKHILPNLAGPIIVYATLTVPQAILQESFLSFLGIGIRPPLPSWGNLAADGLPEINPFRSNWWLIVFPCTLLGVTLVSLNVVGDGLRDVLDPRSRNGRA
jgi:oligopeptide transport system permease protein